MINTTYTMPRFGIGFRSKDKDTAVAEEAMPVIQEDAGVMDRFRRSDTPAGRPAQPPTMGPAGSGPGRPTVFVHAGDLRKARKRRAAGILGATACLTALTLGGMNAKAAHESTAKDMDREMQAIAAVTPKVDEAGDKFVEKLDLPKELKPIIEMSGLQEYGEGAGPILFLTGQLNLYEKATENYFNKQARANPQPVEVQGVAIQQQDVEQENGYDVEEDVAVVTTETVVGPVDTKAWMQGLQGTHTKLVDDHSQPIYSDPDDFDKGIAGEIADVVPEQICVGGSFGIPEVCTPGQLGPSDDPILLGYKQMVVEEDQVDSVKTAAELYSRLSATDKEKLNVVMEKTFTAENPDYEGTYHETMEILKPYYIQSEGDGAGDVKDNLTRTYPFVQDFTADLEHQNKMQTIWFLIMMAGAAGLVGMGASNKRVRQKAVAFKDKLMGHINHSKEDATSPAGISGVLEAGPSSRTIRTDGDEV